MTDLTQKDKVAEEQEEKAHEEEDEGCSGSSRRCKGTRGASRRRYREKPHVACRQQTMISRTKKAIH